MGLWKRRHQGGDPSPAQMLAVLGDVWLRGVTGKDRGWLAAAPQLAALLDMCCTGDSELHSRSAGAAADEAAAGTIPSVAPAELPPLPLLLGNLSETVARRQHKDVQLATVGLETVPATLQQPVKNIAVQLVRNAIVHGIETPEERLARGKTATGRVQVEFQRDADDNCRLQITDDGAGLSVAAIRAAAISRSLSCCLRWASCSSPAT